LPHHYGNSHATVCVRPSVRLSVPAWARSNKPVAAGLLLWARQAPEGIYSSHIYPRDAMLAPVAYKLWPFGCLSVGVLSQWLDGYDTNAVQLSSSDTGHCVTFTSRDTTIPINFHWWFRAGAGGGTCSPESWFGPPDLADRQVVARPQIQPYSC